MSRQSGGSRGFRRPRRRREGGELVVVMGWKGVAGRRALCSRVCTLSVIAIRGKQVGGSRAGYRVVMNRDERDDRPEAKPPAVHLFQGTPTLAPVDALAGGTWIAVNAHGLTFTLMNRTDPVKPPLPERPLSRGLIIPALAHHAEFDNAIGAARRLDWSRYPPCRLTIFAPGAAVDASPRIATFSWSGDAVSGKGVDESIFASDAACFASSGLGDAIVQRRVPLFEQTLQRGLDPSAQAGFHLHRWPDSSPTSVLMSRPAHRTVSITTVEVRETITMAYSAVGRATGPGTDALVVAEPVLASLVRSD